MKKTVIVAAMAALVAGCDQQKTHGSQPECFSITAANSMQPHAALMLNKCTGETWLLVRMNKSDKPDDGFTYQWFKLDKIDMWPPTLVDK